MNEFLCLYGIFCLFCCSSCCCCCCYSSSNVRAFMVCQIYYVWYLGNCTVSIGCNLPRSPFHWITVPQYMLSSHTSYRNEATTVTVTVASTNPYRCTALTHPHYSFVIFYSNFNFYSSTVSIIPNMWWCRDGAHSIFVSFFSFFFSYIPKAGIVVRLLLCWVLTWFSMHY